MGAIERIRERLPRHPELAVVERSGWIEVTPPGETSFAVGLAESHDGYTVYFEGWHEEVRNEEEALNLFAMGLSDSTRLRVTSRGNKDHCWTVETREGDSWATGSTTGLLLFPFWRRKRVRLLQNTVITAAEAH